MKNCLLILIITFIISSFSCKERETKRKLDVKVSLIKAFIEDTIRFEDFSLKIRFYNYSNTGLLLDFKKSPGLKLENNDASFNCWVVWENSKIKHELLLSPLFPSPVEIKSGVKSDFLFLNHGSYFPDIIKVFAGSRSKFDSLLTAMVYKKIYVIITETTTNRGNISDTLPVAIDSSFRILMTKAYVKDFEKHQAQTTSKIKK